MTEQSDAPRSDGTQPAAVMARLLNLTPRRLNQLAGEGVIPKASRGCYELAPTVQGYVKYLQEIAVGSSGVGLARERARLAKEQADKIARENAVAEGELIPKADVVAGMQVAFAHVRARLLAIPVKLAPMLAPIDKAAVIKSSLTAAIHEALDELSRTRTVAEKPDLKKGRRR